MNRKVELNCIIIQLFYYVAAYCWSGFTTVYLSYKGLSDELIAYVSSLNSVLAIVTQLYVSSYVDKHPNSIKKVIISLFSIALVLLGVLYATPLALAVVVFLFCSINTLISNYGNLFSPMYMQYVNKGYPFDYGIVRSAGSFAWSIAAFFMGRIVDKYSPNVTLLVYIIFGVLTILAITRLPKINVVKNDDVIKKNKKSYVDILKDNKILTIFLIGIFFFAAGLMAESTYFIRVVESVGGNTVDLGMSSFIQAMVEVPMMLLIKKLYNKFTYAKLLAFSFFIYAIRCFLFGVVPNLTCLYLTFFLNFFCTGMYAPLSVIFINKIAADDEKVRAQTLVSLFSTGGLGGVIGNIICGRLIGKVGVRLLHVGSSFVILIAVFIMLYLDKLIEKKQRDSI